MKTDDFFYELPAELIAQKPAERRECSSLMAIDRGRGEIAHRKFYDIVEYLRAGDCLVFNKSKVLKARLFGRKPTGAQIETLLLKQLPGGLWQALLRPAKRLSAGSVIVYDAETTATVRTKGDEGLCTLEFHYDGDIYDKIDAIGRMPLPPYIHDTGEYDDRYQTVYAEDLGSAAAPTAGLHFTEALLETLQQKGVQLAFVTLHVGLDTFRPVKVEDVTMHKMHAEAYSISEEAAQRINETKAAGGRVIAVGTTAMRTLEGCYRDHGQIKAVSDKTDIFIYPPYRFGVVDALITNFHLPRSTLLMLVSAFYDREKLLAAYALAIEKRYRFFSFGDAMFLY